MKTLSWALLAIAILPGTAARAWAGAPTDQVRGYTDKVLKVLEDPALTPPERRAAVRRIATDVFDVTETAKRTLGTHWQERTPSEQEEFVRLFTNLLEQTYIARIDEYGGERIVYLDEQVDGDRAIVRAKIITKKVGEVPVEGRLLLKGDRWLIYDVMIANLSLVSNYRSQFDRVIRTSSYDELVKRLQTRIETLVEKDTGAGRKPGPPAKR